jgi:hypothetical protein
MFDHIEAIVDGLSTLHGPNISTINFKAATTTLPRFLKLLNFLV